MIVFTCLLAFQAYKPIAPDPAQHAAYVDVSRKVLKGGSVLLFHRRIKDAKLEIGRPWILTPKEKQNSSAAARIELQKLLSANRDFGKKRSNIISAMVGKTCTAYVVFRKDDQDVWLGYAAFQDNLALFRVQYPKGQIDKDWRSLVIQILSNLPKSVKAIQIHK